MSNVVFAAILPHGDVIPQLAGAQAYLTNQTHLAMTQVGEDMAAAAPDTIVIATPHGLLVNEQVCIGVMESAAGELGDGKAKVSVAMKIDLELSHLIAEEAVAAGVPTVRCVYGTDAEPATDLPLDWGALIPLWYCGSRWAVQPKIVVICPSREVHGELLVEFGRAISRAAAQSGKRVAFIASCDWAHAQSATGPYGYHPDAAKYDVMVQDVIVRNDLLKFLDVDEQYIENAKPDGNWQCLMLAGAIEESPLQPKLLSYQCPTYFGMLVAEYRPKNA